MTDSQVTSIQLRQIGFLFLAFGQVTDNQLDAAEMRVIADRLQTWLSNGVAVTDFLREVIDEYRTFGSEDERRMQASEYAHMLHESLSDLQQKRVLRDVILIGKADGRVSDGELGFVAALKSIFGIAGGDLELHH